MKQLLGFQTIEITNDEKQIPINPKLRTCKIFNCNTILTSFNLGKYCHLHKPLALLAKRESYVKKVDCSKMTRKEHNNAKETT
jgi:hypothetical protein